MLVCVFLSNVVCAGMSASPLPCVCFPLTPLRSANVATGMFVFHILTMAMLVVSCSVYALKHTEYMRNAWNEPYPAILDGNNELYR